VWLVYRMPRKSKTTEWWIGSRSGTFDSYDLMEVQLNKTTKWHVCSDTTRRA
jgi:hypothetical protein